MKATRSGSFLVIGLATAAVVEALHRVASDLIEANQKLIASENEKDLLPEETRQCRQTPEAPSRGVSFRP